MPYNGFNPKHFSWEHNVNFVHYAGSFAVAIRYDISDEDLYPLLDSINGVFLTGGGLDMFLPDGTQHQYYKTARKIYDYSINQKDKFNVSWPILGICQGFEVLHWLANDDYRDTLTNVRIYRESRPFKWTVDPKKESLIFKDFPKSILKRMEKEKLSFHAHDWTVATKSYQTFPKLANFFKILATDQLNGTEFIIAVQAHKYPIFGLMHHPEV